MKKLVVFSVLLLITSNLFSQNINAGEQLQNVPIKKAIKNLSKEAIKRINENNNNPYSPVSNNTKPSDLSGIRQAIKKQEELKKLRINFKSLLKSKSDTMYVIADTTISSDWTHTGNIVIAGNATMTFKKVKATILGDIVLFGKDAHLVCDSSYMYFPQQYFYQRSLIAVMGSHVLIKNSTLDYSDLSHNLVATDNSVIEMQNVINKGFTTNGVWADASINIDGSNQAGEYIITNKVKLDFKNATTILLWHHFADSAKIDFAFPDGANVSSYTFNNKTAGVKGIGYDIKVANCKDVMWGMMPENGSDITISNSKIRAIGLWFMGNDSSDVSGLVNNSKYTDFTAPLSDRNLRLIKSSVMTWSLYPMNSSYINISGCILGEVGSGGSSQVLGTSFYVDGSGGYFWTGDTSFAVAGWSTATTYVRSQNNSIFLFGYSALTNGIASAIGNSILMVMQSSLPQDPVALEGSACWFGNINGPNEAYAGNIIPVIGSAWIDKGPSSLLMDMSHYKMYYQKSVDTTWTAIGDKNYSEVRNYKLADWNTMYLEPGQYNIKLAITDNTPDQNTAEAIKSINLLPAILSDNEQPSTINHQLINVSPNPAKDISTINYTLNEDNYISIRLLDLTGREIKCIASGKQTKGNYNIVINTSELNSGIYFIQLTTGNYIETKKIIVQ